MGREKSVRAQLTSDRGKAIDALAVVDAAVRGAESALNIPTLGEVAEIYEDEARQERRAMWRLLAGAFVLLALASCALAFASSRAVPGDTSEHVDSGRFLVYASLSVPAFVGAAYLARLVSIHRRAARETQRQCNQMLMLDPYLETFPANTRMLYRALLVRRFFPRSTDEFDALEDEEFPPPSMILTSVDPTEFSSPE